MFERVSNLGDTPYLEEALLIRAKVRLTHGDPETARTDLEQVIRLKGDLEQEARLLLKALVSTEK